MKVKSFWLGVVLVVMAFLILFFMGIAVESGKEAGWKWVVECLASLFANIVAALMFLLWFESESETKLKKLLDQLKQPGSRVIPCRERLGPEIYERHIESSNGVEILGIACESVLQGIFPHYEKEDQPFQITNCNKSILYKRLKTDRDAFFANIYFLCPRSSYAVERNMEPDNNKTQDELDKIVSALKRIATVYSEHKPLSEKENEDRWQEPWKLSGVLSFYVFDRHPINTVFWAKKPDSKDALFVGYLFARVSGRHCPSVEFIEANEIRDQCHTHLEVIKEHSRLLFKWDQYGPCFDAAMLKPSDNP